jgi:hypothetical protein
MTVREKLLAAGAMFLLVVLLFGFRAWIAEHDARTKAEATQTAQQEVIATAQKSIDAARADQARTADTLQQQIAALEARKQQPVTPERFVLDLSKALPNLPQPATVVPSAPAAAGNGPAQPPSAASIQIPAADLPALRDYKISCDENSARLTACQLTDASLQQQLDGTQSQLKATAAERDSWKTAARGGSWLHRLGKAAKCLGFSAGGAALGSALDTQQPARGAAIGAIAGGAGCEVF